MDAEQKLGAASTNATANEKRRMEDRIWYRREDSEGSGRCEEATGRSVAVDVAPNPTGSSQASFKLRWIIVGLVLQHRNATQRIRARAAVATMVGCGPQSPLAKGKRFLEHNY